MSDPQQNKTGRGAGERGSDGRFQRGNKASSGAPVEARRKRLRNGVLRRASKERVNAIWDKVWEEATKGTRWAVELILDYSVGRPVPMSMVKEIEDHKQRLVSLERSRSAKKDQVSA
jgi:hypothetical protein